MNYAHTLQDYDSDSRDTLPVTITLDDVSIRVNECEGDLRGVTIEMTNGTMKVRVYASDSEVPVTLVLPETGGLAVDRHDYDMQSPPAENDIDPNAVYVIINTDEPDVTLTLTYFEAQVLKQISNDTLEYMMGNGELSDDEDDALVQIIKKIKEIGE